MSAPRVHTNLRDLRTAGGLSLKHLEAETGIHRGTLSRLERGMQMPTDVEYALLLAHYPAGAAARWWLEGTVELGATT